jgi:hypothetical protein
VSQPSPLKESRPEIPEQDRFEGSGPKVGLEEVWEIMLKIRFDFPCGFFFCVMVPLNLVHSDGFSSSASFFSV